MRKQKFIFIIICFTSSQLLLANHLNESDNLFRADGAKSDTSLINKFINFASTYINSNPDSALYYLNKASTETRRIKYKEGHFKILFLKGKIAYSNNNYSEALADFTKCLNFAEKTNNKLLKAKCLERLASLHLTTDDANLALKLYYESLAIFEEINDKKGIAKVYNILGVYKAETGDFEKAESYLRKSLAIHQLLGDAYNIIENKVNLGYMYELSGKTERAEKTYRDLIPELQEQGVSYALSVVYFNLASLYQKKDSVEQALGFLNLAISIAEQRNDSSLLSSLYGNTGGLLMGMGMPDSAKVFLSKSLLCSQAIDDVENQIHALRYLATIDSLSGDLPSAMRIYQQIAKLKKVLYKQQLDNGLKESELRYENQKSQKKIALQEKIIQTGKKNKWLFITLLIISGFAVLLLTWLHILQKKSLQKNIKLHDQQIRLKQFELESAKNEEKLRKLEKEKTEAALRTKERELVSSALQMEQDKGMLNSIRQKINDLAKQQTINISDLEELDKLIGFKLKDYNNWDLFYQTFNQVHKDFYRKLKEKHPTLSKSELKHCTYIRIHLSANQIASLQNITIDAVRKTRYRIRKKMELEPNDSLDDYLLKF